MTSNGPAGGRPPSFSDMVLVISGGALGTATRAYLDHVYGTPTGGVPVTLWINLTGAFLLGLLLEVLVRDERLGSARSKIQLAVGTGLLGGFTTYSAFALGLATMLREGHPALGFMYLSLTVVVGGVATLLGIVCGRAVTKRPRPTPPAVKEGERG